MSPPCVAPSSQREKPPTIAVPLKQSGTRHPLHSIVDSRYLYYPHYCQTPRTVPRHHRPYSTPAPPRYHCCRGETCTLPAATSAFAAPAAPPPACPSTSWCRGFRGGLGRGRGAHIPAAGDSSVRRRCSRLRSSGRGVGWHSPVRGRRGNGKWWVNNTPLQRTVRED